MRGVLSGYLELSSKRAHHVGGYERSWISHGDHHIRSWQGKLSQAACEANKQEELYLKANGIMYYKATDGTVHAGRRGPSLGFSFAGHYPESAVRKVLPVDTTGNAGPGSQEPYRPFMRDFELSTAGNYGRKRDHIRKPVVQKELRELNLSASRSWTIEDREWYERHRSRLADLDLIKTRRPRRLQRRQTIHDPTRDAPGLVCILRSAWYSMASFAMERNRAQRESEAREREPAAAREQELASIVELERWLRTVEPGTKRLLPARLSSTLCDIRDQEVVDTTKPESQMMIELRSWLQPVNPGVKRWSPGYLSSTMRQWVSNSV